MSICSLVIVECGQGVFLVLFPVVSKSHDKLNIKAKNTLWVIMVQHDILYLILSYIVKIVLSQQCKLSQKFEVTYTLETNKLITEYNIINLDENFVQCGFGAHLAFAVTFDDKHQFSDYDKCSQSKSQIFIQLHQKIFIQEKLGTLSYLKLSQVIILLYNDTLVYSGFTNKKV